MSKLTIATVKAARYEGVIDEEKGTASADIRWDSEVRGLGLRVFPSGRSSYVLKYRNNAGRSRLLTIGPTDSLPLAQARTRAARLKVKVLDGGDPVDERREARARMTVGELFDKYIEEHSRPNKKSWREDKRRLDHASETIGRLKLDALTSADVEKLHTELAKSGAKKGVEANRTVELIRAAINKARKWHDLDRAHPNVAAGIALTPETERERFLTKDELPRVLTALREHPDVYARSALLLTLLTGVRKSEALALTWERVDARNRLLHIATTKSGKGRVVPITDAAERLLDSVLREHGNPHVFPGARAGTALSPKRLGTVWRTVRVKARVPDITVHDLRRSAGSHLAMANVSLPIIAQILGHDSLSATKIYARLQPGSGAAALEDYGRMIDTIARKSAS